MFILLRVSCIFFFFHFHMLFYLLCERKCMKLLFISRFFSLFFFSLNPWSYFSLPLLHHFVQLPPSLHPLHTSLHPLSISFSLFLSLIPSFLPSTFPPMSFFRYVSCHKTSKHKWILPKVNQNHNLIFFLYPKGTKGFGVLQVESKGKGERRKKGRITLER